MLNTNEARIETSTLCNYSCVFCPHKTTFNRSKEIMSYERLTFLVDKINKELPDITDITLGGMGDVFTDPNIIDKLKYCKDYGYTVHVLTNGSLLNTDLIDQMVDIGINDLRISLHSLKYESYNKITGASEIQFKNVLDILEYINENTKIPLIVSFAIVDGINNPDIESVKKYFKKYDDITIEIWKAHNWANGFEYRSGQAIYKTCGRPLNGPYQIQIDGSVVMCCFDYNNQLKLGNFLTQTMKEIFSGYLYTQLKRYHENGTLYKTSYICKDCDQRKSKEGIVIFNNKFKSEDRLKRTSTNYAKFT